MSPDAALEEITVRFADRALRVVRGGHGPVNVVFEAGGGNGADSWAAVQRLLGENITSFSYDRPGEATGEWTLDGSVADLRGLLAAAGVGAPRILVAHSLGCHIVRDLVAREPDAATAVLLVDARPPHFEQAVLAADLPIFVPPPEVPIVKAIAAADTVVDGISLPAGVDAVAICSERFDAAPGEFTSVQSDEIAALWLHAQGQLAQAIGQDGVRVVPGTGHDIPNQAPAYVASLVERCAAAVC